jgi:hypothetical protein
LVGWPIEGSWQLCCARALAGARLLPSCSGALLSQRLGGPCGGRGLRLLHVTPVPDRMRKSLDSWPWLPGLMRQRPGRFKWSGLSFIISLVHEAVATGEWAMESGPDGQDASEGAQRPRRRAWWRARAVLEAVLPVVGSNPSIPSFLMSSHFLVVCTGFYGVRPVRCRFDHLSKIVKGVF